MAEIWRVTIDNPLEIVDGGEEYSSTETEPLSLLFTARRSAEAFAKEARQRFGVVWGPDPALLMRNVADAKQHVEQEFGGWPGVPTTPHRFPEGVGSSLADGERWCAAHLHWIKEADRG